MITRARDFIRNVRPQGQVSFEEWQDVQEKFSYAKQFLTKANPIYIEMKNQLKETEDDILENRLREVHNFEFNQALSVVQRMFITPKKLQDDEAIGQVKFLRNFFATLQSWIDVKERYEKQEADGVLIIDRGRK